MIVKVVQYGSQMNKKKNSMINMSILIKLLQTQISDLVTKEDENKTFLVKKVKK